MLWTTDTFPSSGTTSLIPIPDHGQQNSGQQNLVDASGGYFFIQVCGAQAAFSAPFWAQPKALVVASQVSFLRSAGQEEEFKFIQRTRTVRQGAAVQLGLTTNLVSLVPTTMESVSISIEFILDVHNRLFSLANLINSDVFTSAVSVDPTAALTAKAVGKISQKILDEFLQEEQKQPILQFNGTFNISSGVRPGLYAILSATSDHYPLPNPLPRLSVHNGQLLGDGQPLTQVSYVILRVASIPWRTRNLSANAAWNLRIIAAEDKAISVGENFLATPEEKHSVWQECLTLLKEAQVLLAADPNYHRAEAQAIVKSAFQSCQENLNRVPDTRRSTQEQVEVVVIQEEPDDRLHLNIAPEEDLTQIKQRYALQSRGSLNELARAGLYTPP